MEAGEGLGDAAMAVLHVDDDKVIAGEAGDLGESWGEGEEEEAVESLAVLEAGLEVLGGGGDGGGGGGGCGGGGVVGGGG